MNTKIIVLDIYIYKEDTISYRLIYNNSKLSFISEPFFTEPKHQAIA